LLAAGTDGSDGPTDATGAIVDGSTCNDEAEKYLKNNDAYTFFELYGGLIKTGPTHTNVMDLVVTLKKEMARMT
jgi:hydroxypyruvate reductase